jgi:Tfp pilus assembly protein PilV
MVALAILGVAVVAIFQLFSLTLRSTKKADDYTKALFYARSAMDQAYVNPDVETGSDSKDFDDGFKAEITTTQEPTPDDAKAKLYRITVTVTWPPSNSLTITGIRNYYETSS